jgi:hypothetical protein
LHNYRCARKARNRVAQTLGGGTLVPGFVFEFGDGFDVIPHRVGGGSDFRLIWKFAAAPVRFRC